MEQGFIFSIYGKNGNPQTSYDKQHEGWYPYSAMFARRSDAQKCADELQSRGFKVTKAFPISFEVPS